MSKFKHIFKIYLVLYHPVLCSSMLEKKKKRYVLVQCKVIAQEDKVEWGGPIFVNRVTICISSSSTNRVNFKYTEFQYTESM